MSLDPLDSSHKITDRLQALSIMFSDMAEHESEWVKIPLEAIREIDRLNAEVKLLRSISGVASSGKSASEIFAPVRHLLTPEEIPQPRVGVGEEGVE